MTSACLIGASISASVAHALRKQQVRLHLSQGSLKEVETHLLLAQRVGNRGGYRCADQASRSHRQDASVIDPRIAKEGRETVTPAPITIHNSLLTIHYSPFTPS